MTTTPALSASQRAWIAVTATTITLLAVILLGFAA
jgi:hypothetical protein